MGYLLDTSVISEHTRKKPNGRVLEWLRSLPLEEQYLSVLSIGEIRHGIERLEAGARRERLRLWLERDLQGLFGDRLLALTSGVVERWGRLRAEMRLPVPAIDSLLAATALHHELRLVTRDDQDFVAFPGLIVVNPWRQ
jgi:predicted nucleic acid-binding protein